MNFYTLWLGWKDVNVIDHLIRRLCVNLVWCSFFQIFIMAFKIPAQLHRDIEITQFTMDSIVFEKNIGNGASGVADLVKWKHLVSFFRGGFTVKQLAAWNFILKEAGLLASLWLTMVLYHQSNISSIVYLFCINSKVFFQSLYIMVYFGFTVCLIYCAFQIKLSIPNTVA